MEITTVDELKELSRIGTIILRKKAGRRDYFGAIWINKSGYKCRIVRRVSVYVYIRRIKIHLLFAPAWTASGGYPPRGASEKYTIGEFLKNFKVVKN